MKYPLKDDVHQLLEKVLVKHRLQESNDDEVIRELQEIIDEHRDIACRFILQKMAGLDLPIEQACFHWQETLAHKEKMSSALNRKVSLISAICDYFSSLKDTTYNLKLIDIQKFDEVIKGTIHDGLTGIFNRNHFNETLEQQLSTAKRYDTDISLLFMDVDNFKDVNDTYGHQAGDRALQAIAKAISKEKRESDIVARYGGEEFVLLMPHTNNINAFILAERIRKKIARLKIVHNGSLFSLTISGGIASFPVNGNTPQELLQRADSALYQAKGAGKDNITQYKLDKRRYLRVKFCEEIQIKELGFNTSDQFSGMSKDICSGGILFENKKPLPIGMRIQVSIPIQDTSPLLLIGTVVRIEIFEGGSCDIGMSISFKEMDQIAHQEIAEFLKREREATG